MSTLKNAGQRSVMVTKLGRRRGSGTQARNARIRGRKAFGSRQHRSPSALRLAKGAEPVTTEKKTRRKASLKSDPDQ